MIVNAIKAISKKIKIKYFLTVSVDAFKEINVEPYLQSVTDNVMVGSVRNRTQIDFNLSHNCYYVPAQYVDDIHKNVEYMALLEDKSVGSSHIAFKGRVIKRELVKRKDIPVPLNRPNGEDLYLYFTVDKWHKLDRPVILNGTYKGTPLYTSEYLLQNCSYSFQLFNINSKNDFVLSTVLGKCRTTERFLYKIGEFYIELKSGLVKVRNKDCKVVGKYNKEDYFKMPSAIFKKIKNQCKH